MTVSIADPLNNVVASWKDVPLIDMVVQFDFQLTEEPPMGTWHINVKYDDKKSPEEVCAFAVSFILRRFLYVLIFMIALFYMQYISKTHRELCCFIG